MALLTTMVTEVLLTDQLYREQLLEHYRQPRNHGKLLAYDAQATGHNSLCGDTIHVQLQLKNGELTKMCFTGQGCAISIAAASLLSEQITGQLVEVVGRLGLSDIETLLGVRLPPVRIKCGLLALEAVQVALR